MTDMRRMAEENGWAVFKRDPRPHTPPPWIFRPPWLREAGVGLAIVGAVALVLGAAVAAVGWYGEQVAAEPERLAVWVHVGVWAGGLGALMLAVGLVLALAKRMR